MLYAPRDEQEAQVVLGLVRRSYELALHPRRTTPIGDEVGLRREVPGPVVAVCGTLAGRRYRREIAPVWR